ncbi:isoleucyl-trna synthetase like protein [Zymoseptoria brevis]|uniref:isoleucine--tRNA ligase n=1 Tax=Zymoseptoria brevis TaxID=1047168 RepID=A0A0F4G6T5_9PEZI|nr:isoleucyl-trna synthetase like protein [Zymoseptoria brevis]
MLGFTPSLVLRAASQEKSNLIDTIRTLALTKTNWSDTLALPRSPFPARPTLEQLEKYRQRCSDDLYEWQRSARASHRGGKEEFVLHDGPPYANGDVHVGHALNKVLKDLMLRSELSRGKNVQYRPGWDCHGLPIELKALQQPKAPGKQAKSSKDTPAQEARAAAYASSKMSASEIRTAARKLASETIETQKKSFQDWGVMGEWNRPYTTMSAEFEARQLGVFREMVRKGLISRHHRPVYWSPSSRTALAEAELEYDDSHKCTAAFVKMPMTRLPHVLKTHSSIRPGCLSALIWTTTPWTLPANKAIAIRNDIEYTVIELAGESESTDQFILAKDRIEHVLSQLPGCTAKIIVNSITGSQLCDGDVTCFNLFTAAESPIVHADFVTATSGTGLVHMAPGHGMDDYQVCQQLGIGPALAPVDDEGKYTAEVFLASQGDTQLEGLDVQTAGVKAVLQILNDPSKHLPDGIYQSGESLILAAHSFVHKNPIDWRTKQPVIIRATAQWFADVSLIKDRALAALEDVTCIPESGKTRLKSFIEGRSQWCISRQRAWGVPIPALYSVDTGEACISTDAIDHIISVIEERGTDAWFSDPQDEPSWLHPSLEPGKWVRGRDTMDVWFDSGTTWTSLAAREGEEAHLSDVYSEGTDQHRGWFQSSLLTAIASQDPDSKPLAPFRILTTHGFTLDGEGRKMSKSLGNVIAPDQIISGTLLPPSKGKGKGKAPPPTSKSKQQGILGPDVLRLWVASSDYTRDVAISQPVLQSVQQALQKYRVTFKFLLGVLHDYPSPCPQPSLLSTLDFADRVVLSQLEKCSRSVFEAYKSYKFYAAISEVNKFVNNDLSAFYFEIAKDRLYAGDFRIRRHTQTVLVYILQELTKMLGPATPLLVEEVWEWIPMGMKSLHGEHGEADMGLHPLRQVWEGPFDAGKVGVESGVLLTAAMEAFKKVSSAVKVAQEEARTARLLGSGLACRVVVQLPAGFDVAADGDFAFLREDLAGLLVVSQAEVIPAANLEATSSEDNPEWRYEQPFEVEVKSQMLEGKVIVLPPAGEKCVRCWKYTAEEENLPCSQCRVAIAEQL